MQNRIITYIVVGILLLAVVIVVGFYFVKKQSTPSPAEQLAPVVTPPEAQEKVPPEKAPTDETASWKTYRNEKYGFEIKYPSYFISKTEDLMTEADHGETILAVGRKSEDGYSAERIKVEIFPGQQFNEFITSDGILKYYFKFSREQGEWIFVPSDYSSEENLGTSLVPVIPKKYITKNNLTAYVGGRGNYHGTQGRSVSEIGLIENQSKNFLLKITITRCMGQENDCGVWLSGGPSKEPEWFSSEKTIFSVLDSVKFE